MELDHYYGNEERYLKAVSKIIWDEYSDTKILLEQILENSPDYGRAHFKLGCIYFFQLKDFQSADYHFRLCINVEPEFTEVYPVYLEYLNIVNENEKLGKLANKALNVAGVNKSAIYFQLGLSEEQNLNFVGAKKYYDQALCNSTIKANLDIYKEHIERLEFKSKIMDVNANSES